MERGSCVSFSRRPRSMLVITRMISNRRLSRFAGLRLRISADRTERGHTAPKWLRIRIGEQLIGFLAVKQPRPDLWITACEQLRWKSSVSWLQATKRSQGESDAAGNLEQCVLWNNPKICVLALKFVKLRELSCFWSNMPLELNSAGYQRPQILGIPIYARYWQTKILQGDHCGINVGEGWVFTGSNKPVYVCWYRLPRRMLTRDLFAIANLLVHRAIRKWSEQMSEIKPTTSPHLNRVAALPCKSAVLWKVASLHVALAYSYTCFIRLYEMILT